MVIGSRRRGVCGFVAAILLMAGCGGDSDDELLVFAASSLTESFGEIETAFEAANPEVDIALNFAGSSSLREQALAGAPVDIFATANLNDLFSIDDAGLLAGTAELFATNQLQIAVPAGNPGGVSGLGDFADPALAIGLCAQPVPCGIAADLVLSSADVVAAPDTFEPDVKALAQKLADGELDAGLVYITDIEASQGALEAIEIGPAIDTQPVVYAIMQLVEESPEAASFVEFVMSEAGQAILVEHGFGAAE